MTIIGIFLTNDTILLSFLSDASGVDLITNSGVSHASQLGHGKKGNLFTEELAKNNLPSADDDKSKEEERKSDTTEKPDVEVEDADEEDDDDDENNSGSGKIEFGSADLADNDDDDSVCCNGESLKTRVVLLQYQYLAVIKTSEVCY